MLGLLAGLGAMVAVLTAVVAYQRRNGNRGEVPAPYAGAHDHRENHDM